MIINTVNFKSLKDYKVDVLIIKKFMLVKKLSKAIYLETGIFIGDEDNIETYYLQRLGYLYGEELLEEYLENIS